MRQLLQQGEGVGMAARQLVDGVQRGHDAGQYLGRQDVGVQVGADGGHGVGRNRSRADRKAGPCQQRNANQQAVVRLALVVDAAGFAAGFDHVHQGVVSVGLGREQLLQGAVDGFLVLGLEMLVEQHFNLALPSALLKAAGGLNQCLRQLGQAVAVGGKFTRRFF